MGIPLLPKTWIARFSKKIAAGGMQLFNKAQRGGKGENFLEISKWFLRVLNGFVIRVCVQLLSKRTRACHIPGFPI